MSETTKTVARASAASTKRTHRLSPTVIAIAVVGLVAAAGTVGATIGGAGGRRQLPPSTLPIPASGQLQPTPLPRASGSNIVRVPTGGGRLGTHAFAAALTPITRPADGTPTTGVSTLTLVPKPRPGSGTAVPTTQPDTSSSPTTRQTNTTRPAPRPRNTTTTEPAPEVFTPDGTDTTVPNGDTTPPPVDTTADSTPDQTPGSTSDGQPGKPLSIGNGLAVTPASGYKIVKQFNDGGVMIGNNKSLVDMFTSTGGTAPAAQIVANVIAKYLPQRFESIQTTQPKAIKPPKSSIKSFAAASYKGVIAGNQGSQAIEGMIFVAVRQDGLTMFYIPTWLEGQLDTVSTPIGAMLGSVLASM